MTTTDEFVADAFRDLLEREGEAFRRLMTYYECAIMETETKLRVFDAEFGLQHDRNPIESICTRLKSPESTVEKLVRKGHPITVGSIEGNLNDMAGVRVVCTLPEDAYSLAESLTLQDDVTLIECRDYITNPKESGYRSLHLIVEIPIFLEREKRPVRVELQFRSIAQNFWASLDHQMRYKKGLDAEERAAVSQELKELSDAAAELDRRMQALRQRLFGDEDGQRIGCEGMADQR